MPAHLRVSLADRPGALATLTRALAAAGANVLSVVVLQRESGRAVDDLLLDWPYARPWDAVVRAVEATPGARLHGLRHVDQAEPVPDGEVLRQVLDQPPRAVEVLVDALPSLLLADWAAVVDRRWPREPILATPHSPLPMPAVPAALPRPRALTGADAPLLALPFDDGDRRLLVGRTGGPGFTRTERDRATVMLATVLGIARLAYADATAAAPAEVTAQVLWTNSATTRPSCSPASS